MLSDPISELQSQYTLDNIDNPDADSKSLFNSLLPTYADTRPHIPVTQPDQLLTEDLPFFGRVPMLFFLPEQSNEAQTLRKLIQKHGGIVIYIPECCCYQLCCQKEPDLALYQKGHIYSSQWVTDSIASLRLQPTVEYIHSQVTQSQQISFSRSKFTLREILKIFEVVEQYPSKRTKNPTYWSIWMARGYFPGRSVHSINA